MIQFNTHQFKLITITHKNALLTGCPVKRVHITTPGCFCVFFPTDVHRPAVEDGVPMTVRKVVVKVSIELLK